MDEELKTYLEGMRAEIIGRIDRSAEPMATGMSIRFGAPLVHRSAAETGESSA